MLMKGPVLSVALATNHLPLSKVPGALKTPKLVAQLELLDRGLRARLGRRPRIAVCGLNPHASDGGVLGSEEDRDHHSRDREGEGEGPRRERAVRGRRTFAGGGDYRFDVALAMFHDQGLVATRRSTSRAR